MTGKSHEGYTLIELLVALWIWGVISAIALPCAITAADRADLRQTVAHVVSDIRTAQITAEEGEAFQELRFAPFANYYWTYDSRVGLVSFVPFAGSIHYYEGYLHLPEPNLRFNDQGDISESGQIGFVDQEGSVQNIILYLQYGDLRVTDHMLR